MTLGYDSYTPSPLPDRTSSARQWFDPVESGSGEPPGRSDDAPAAGAYLVSDATDTAYPVVSAPVDAAGEPDPVDPPVPARRRGSGAFALVLVLVLGSVVGWQAWRLDRLDDRLTAADRLLGDALAVEASRGTGVEARTADLEQQAGRAFDPEAIATAVLPSVFRVRAGNFTGTAFAVGGRAPAGSTNLLTNYHVVASVWESGGREVLLERGDVEVSARLLDVDEDEDLALLRMQRRAGGLVAAPTAAKSGQPIVVVGAPLGLEDTVTTGVISAFRTDDNDGPRIQFDAPINPGNSGGPVINSAKQVVGVATAKARDAEGIGLAIPVRTACTTFEVC